MRSTALMRQSSRIRMFQLQVKAARRRARSRPQLERLEDRLPPNNLGALGDLIAGLAASAAQTRTAGPQDDTHSGVAVSRGSGSAAAGRVVAPSAPTIATTSASVRTVGSPAVPNAPASVTGANATATA